MIIEINKTKNVIPHFQNILDIHESNPSLSLIDEFNPFFAGGYPMSLLLAPRLKSNNLKIKRGYYSDYDVYFTCKDDFENACKKLDDHNEVDKKVETPNATTYILHTIDPSLGNRVQLQLIRKFQDPPKSILGSFDFVNCAVGFSPNTGSLYFHKHLFRSHNIRELEILKPWMLDTVTDDTVNNVVIQIARFKKYCMRWDYTLSEKSFSKLLKVYEKYPNLKTSRNIQLACEGGSYDQQVFIATRDQNIWEVISSLIRINPKWRTYTDPHGILSGTTDEKEEQPIIVSQFDSYRDSVEATNNQVDDDVIPF